MPELCRFFGIIIRMQFGDHAPPHFHAVYGDSEVVINIKTLGVEGGKVSGRALALIIEWASLHQEELMKDWEKAVNHQPVDKIEPLS